MQQSTVYNQGLYRPQLEHESCGVGFVANTQGAKSHQVIQMGLEVLTNLSHRGATGADPDTGDGAGILIQLPDAFFRRETARLGINLPAPVDSTSKSGANIITYAVGMLFLPKEPNARYTCEGLFEQLAKARGLRILGWREVPVVETAVGAAARATCPLVTQVFVEGTYSESLGYLDLERTLYVLRRQFERKITELNARELNNCYVCSLSSQVIVYKGQLLAQQISAFYPDLIDPLLQSALAVVHQRYSTNTFPSWKLAHPYRMLAHNGEINTIQGNRHWFNAGEALLPDQWFQHQISDLTPILQPNCSDSGTLDNALEFLCLSGYSLAHAMKLLIPEAWHHNAKLPQTHKDFYAFNELLMAPWDGPAALVFTDGKQIGAALDRNGLRPSRYQLTQDHHLILASEAGVLSRPDAGIIKRGKLGPGEMLILDLTTGQLSNHLEIMTKLSSEAPYSTWLSQAISKTPCQEPSHASYIDYLTTTQLRSQQMVFGYTEETLQRVIAPMLVDGHEAISSMGNDTPLAVLSQQPKLLFDYFRQLFAQVTNPPIDPIREKSVFSLHQHLGGNLPLLNPNPKAQASYSPLEAPVISQQAYRALTQASQDSLKAITLPMLFEADTGTPGLEQALTRLKTRAAESVALGYRIIILTDQNVDRFHAPIPSLLALSAVHNHLIAHKLSAKVNLIVCSGEVRDPFHAALLIGFGATAVHPWLLLESSAHLVKTGIYLKASDDKALPTTTESAQANCLASLNTGILKIISKLGITTLTSFKGAALFEALGLGKNLVDDYFPGLLNSLPAAEIDTITKESLLRHRHAYSNAASPTSLELGGQIHWSKGSEAHLMKPEVIVDLQRACRENDWTRYQKFAQAVNHAPQQAVTIRNLLTFKPQRSIPLELVESEEDLLKRFCTGAMSFGSLSEEAHTTLAIAMNRMGGKSNSGEGGEAPDRYLRPLDGDYLGSQIKQVAAARFGVTTDYLVSAQELQIKVAQGAKPGEGGHLPGHKVTEAIAKVRHATPGVTLISPPPHHDIYSIEDLEQLIYDLKSVNPTATISVKLVSEAGVGTVAAGVAKGKADTILISGHDGGTGAAPLTAIHSAGMPWEIGLAEAHQTLMRNNLRGRVTLQCDGQMRTGRDVAIAAILGAETFGFATAPLIVSGCIQMRKCHDNTCPVGIATQDPILRQHFKGKPEHVITYFKFIVKELREIMATLGIQKLEDMVGRPDLLQVDPQKRHWKTKDIDFSQLLYQAQLPERFARHKQDQEGTLNQSSPRHETRLDQDLAQRAITALKEGKTFHATCPLRNTHRAVGTYLGGLVARHYGGNSLSDDTITLNFKGSAGQSFGAFLPKGITLNLTGEANDYVAKGLSGGKITLHNPSATPEDILCGNTVLYGATSGELYVAGRAGERFAVRNSGAHAVVEGIGDHGCEYMTGGRVIVLGSVGKNFAAGMSGGIAYVYDPNKALAPACNLTNASLSPATPEDLIYILSMLEKHVAATKSKRAQVILKTWTQSAPHFYRLISHEYEKAISIQASQLRKEAVS